MAGPIYPVTIDTLGKLIEHEMGAFMLCAQRAAKPGGRPCAISTLCGLRASRPGLELHQPALAREVRHLWRAKRAGADYAACTASSGRAVTRIPKIPLKEIARAVVFLAGEEGGFMTGSTLSINGGHYMT